jgi:hypothetical protein
MADHRTQALLGRRTPSLQLPVVNENSSSSSRRRQRLHPALGDLLYSRLSPLDAPVPLARDDPQTPPPRSVGTPENGTRLAPTARPRRARCDRSSRPGRRYEYPRPRRGRHGRCPRPSRARTDRLVPFLCFFDRRRYTVNRRTRATQTRAEDRRGLLRRSDAGECPHEETEQQRHSGGRGGRGQGRNLARRALGDQVSRYSFRTRT